MSAMEQMFISMLSKMTGLSPEGMQASVRSAIDLLVTIEHRFSSIEQKLDILLHNCGAMDQIIKEPLYIEHSEDKDISND